MDNPVGKTSKELHQEWSEARSEERHQKKLAWQRQWRADNPDKVKGYYYSEKYREQRHVYAKSEKGRAAQRRTFEKNKEKVYARHKKYRDTEKAKAVSRAYHATYYTTPLKRIHHLAYAVGTRAKKAGMNFDSGLFDALETNIPTQCTCCGVKLAYTNQKRAEDTPSIDRVDSTKGYVVGNAFIVCNRCNRLKDNGSIHDFENILAYMKARILKENW